MLADKTTMKDNRAKLSSTVATASDVQCMYDFQLEINPKGLHIAEARSWQAKSLEAESDWMSFLPFHASVLTSSS